jgi:DNA-binding XRE family transcriptional regulator
MRTSWKELKEETMSAAEILAGKKLADAELAVIEMNQLREAAHITQTVLAHKLKITQAAVSRLETRNDLHLSTLSDYIRALGGVVEIRAVFPNRTVKLTHVATGAHARRQSPQRSARAFKM